MNSEIEKFWNTSGYVVNKRGPSSSTLEDDKYIIVWTGFKEEQVIPKLIAIVYCDKDGNFLDKEILYYGIKSNSEILEQEAIRLIRLKVFL